MPLSEEERAIATIDNLLCSEKECVEFKHNNEDPEMIGKLCSAISNSALANGKDCGYILWGIDNNKREVIGTTFDPTNKIVGNQVFEFWLTGQLTPDLYVHIQEVNHPNGKVVIFKVPAAANMLSMFKGTSYIRIGSATPPLNNYPERLQNLLGLLNSHTWESKIARDNLDINEIMNLLETEQYFKLNSKQSPSSPSAIAEVLEADGLVKQDRDGTWGITNLGAILFAKNLNEINPRIARKGIRFVKYDGVNRVASVTHKADGIKGYAIAFPNFLRYLNSILPINELIKEIRSDIKLYPEIALREIVANALIHQDMTITGSGPQVELFEDRIEITNPGTPLIDVDRMIDLPPRSRNEALASLARRMGMCEERGSGLDKVVASVELHQLPPPYFQQEENSMKVTLYSPRSFAKMTPTERIRACYQHAVIKHLSGEKMKNSTLCERFGIELKNAAQVTKVITGALDNNFIKYADPKHTRSGYVPIWA